MMCPTCSHSPLGALTPRRISAPEPTFHGPPRERGRFLRIEFPIIHLFYLQDPSLLEFQRRFQDTIQNNNLRTVFGVHSIPVDSQLRQIIDSHDQPRIALLSAIAER